MLAPTRQGDGGPIRDRSWHTVAATGRSFPGDSLFKFVVDLSKLELNAVLGYLASDSALQSLDTMPGVERE
jgi:hypothetical protein